MKLLPQIKEAILHIIYPHICAGCGTDILPATSQLCIKCIHDLPLTYFEKHTNNPIEKIFAGRLRFQEATAQMYFNKHTVLQRLLHQFKYKGNKNLGHQLGLIMGYQLLESGRFKRVDALIPLPLHHSKERMRGYNQANILCNGIAEILKVPVINDAVVRTQATETQTRKNRVERWQNMEGKFMLKDSTGLQNKNVLLVDDVVTTGATLEACATVLLNITGIEINIATLCSASHI